jgi:hypothetical protein
MFQSTFPVQRLRRRYRDVLRAQVAATLENPDKAAVEEELRALFAALGGWPEQKIGAPRVRFGDDFVT